jgi:hypothetical protein
LDHLLFWTTGDLENKLLDFRTYFNNHRTHTSLEARTPVTPMPRPIANLRSFRWQPHCRSLYQTPMAARTLSRLGPTAASGQPLKTPRMKSSGICDLGYRAFRGSDRFTATGCVPKREPVHLRNAITGKIGSPVTIRQP